MLRAFVKKKKEKLRLYETGSVFIEPLLAVRALRKTIFHSSRLLKHVMKTLISLLPRNIMGMNFHPI